MLKDTKNKNKRSILKQTTKISLYNNELQSEIKTFKQRKETNSLL